MPIRVTTSPEGTEIEHTVPERRGRGRPREPNARARVVSVRAVEEEVEDLKRRALEAGLSVTDFARSLLWPLDTTKETP